MVEYVSETKKSNRQTYIDVLRVIATIAVINIHVIMNP